MGERQGIKVTDIAYARVSVPDLEAAEQFLTDFGLIKVERVITSYSIHYTKLYDTEFRT